MDYKQKIDKWYEKQGVKPPERTSSGITEDEIPELLKKNIEGHKCQWVQRGPNIACTSGANEHGQRIGTTRRLKGTGENGEPLLEMI